MKKRILVFGDSNTWGWKPENMPPTIIERWDDDERWTGILQKELGEEYSIITEGLSGRTTVWEDPIEEERCGKVQMLPIMDSQAPFDLMIIFLGSNDMKSRFHASAWDSAQGAGLLVQKALAQVNAFRNEPKVLLMAPTSLGDSVEQSCHIAFYGSVEKSKKLGYWYEKVANQLKVDFIDAGQIVKSSEIDGLHFDKDQHELLGKAVADKVKEIMFNKNN